MRALYAWGEVPAFPEVWEALAASAIVFTNVSLYNFVWEAGGSRGHRTLCAHDSVILATQFILSNVFADEQFICSRLIAVRYASVFRHTHARSCRDDHAKCLTRSRAGVYHCVPHSFSRTSWQTPQTTPSTHTTFFSA